MLELKALHVPDGHYDVAVLGGGLAGLTMAIQLKLARPETRVLVTDKRTEPAPEAAFKVGESSVEIGAHYYREVIGMRDHLEQAQLRKLGLRFLLPAGDNSDITKRVEFCTPAHLAAFTHQIDRGRFENELFRRCLKDGAEAFRGWRVQDVEIGEDAAHDQAEPGGGGDERHGPLDRRRERPREHPAPQARPRRRHRPPHQRRLDPARRRPRLRGVGTDDEEWLDRMPERGPAPALDHPPDRTRATGCG